MTDKQITQRIFKLLKNIYNDSTLGDIPMLKKLVKTLGSNPIEAVVVEFLNDSNNWEWSNIVRNSTPRRAIKEYLKDNKLLEEGEKIKFTTDKEEVTGRQETYAKAHDVRAFCITIL